MKVILQSCGNPDYQQDPDRPLPGVPDQAVVVESLAEASMITRGYITEHDLGSGNLSEVLVRDDQNKVIATVSYNGKVWSLSNELLYNPYE